MAFIYKLVNNDTKSVFYVGRTGVVGVRESNHRIKFKNINFTLKVIEECEDDEERIREYYWMRRLTNEGHILINKNTYGRYSKKNKFIFNKKNVQSIDFCKITKEFRKEYNAGSNHPQPYVNTFKLIQ